MYDVLGQCSSSKITDLFLLMLSRDAILPFMTSFCAQCISEAHFLVLPLPSCHGLTKLLVMLIYQNISMRSIFVEISLVTGYIYLPHPSNVNIGNYRLKYTAL